MAKVHLDGTGTLKNGPQAIGKSRDGWTTEIHMVAANAETPIKFSLSSGHRGDVPCGRELPPAPGGPSTCRYLLMEKAYEGNETRRVGIASGHEPVAPLTPNRSAPRKYDKWNCKYHVVFAPKYRRQIFYGGRKREIGEILCKLCEWKGMATLEAECCPDHIHMLLEIPPKMSVSGFMGYLKGKSSLMLYERFGELKV